MKLTGHQRQIVDEAKKIHIMQMMREGCGARAFGVCENGRHFTIRITTALKLVRDSGLFDEVRSDWRGSEHRRNRKRAT